jgi:hypothetical protein
MRHQRPGGQVNDWNGFISKSPVICESVSSVAMLLSKGAMKKKINLFSDANTEWHEMQVKSPPDRGELKQRLCDMLDLFPRWKPMGGVGRRG